MTAALLMVRRCSQDPKHDFLLLVALQVLMPQLEALNADITVLAADTDSERRKQEATSREVADLKDKLQQVLQCFLDRTAAFVRTNSVLTSSCPLQKYHCNQIAVLDPDCIVLE